MVHVLDLSDVKSMGVDNLSNQQLRFLVKKLQKVCGTGMPDEMKCDTSFPYWSLNLLGLVVAVIFVVIAVGAVPAKPAACAISPGGTCQVCTNVR